MICETYNDYNIGKWIYESSTPQLLFIFIVIEIVVIIIVLLLFVPVFAVVVVVVVMLIEPRLVVSEQLPLILFQLVQNP